MNPIAAILDFCVLYRYSLILSLACGAGICFFMSCCNYVHIPSHRASVAALMSVVLSFPLSRLFYWYGRPDSFPSLLLALKSSSTEDFALIGAFFGCTIAALAAGGAGGRKKMLDCMSVAGCASLSLGRLGFFFTETDRGQVMLHLKNLPWAYPVVNVSGQLEYRFATFLFQAAAAAFLGIFLAVLFVRKKQQPGNISILFVLFYSASQVLLDSTRYDSLYLRSNGFVSIVQIGAAAALILALIILSIHAVKELGLKYWMFPLWSFLIALLVGVGFMEYYVQRHGEDAAFAYSAMAIYLAAIIAIALIFWYWPQDET